MNQKNELVRITINLPKEIHQKLKDLAAREGKSMRQIIIESLETYIPDRLSDDEQFDKLVKENLKKHVALFRKLAKK